MTLAKYCYITREGTPLWGNTPREIISSLRKKSWFRGSSLESYMKKAAKRARIQTGAEIRGAAATKLLSDLISAGLIRKERSN